MSLDVEIKRAVADSVDSFLNDMTSRRVTTPERDVVFLCRFQELLAVTFGIFENTAPQCVTATGQSSIDFVLKEERTRRFNFSERLSGVSYGKTLDAIFSFADYAAFSIRRPVNPYSRGASGLNQLLKLSEKNVTYGYLFCLTLYQSLLGLESEIFEAYARLGLNTRSFAYWNLMESAHPQINLDMILQGCYAEATKSSTKLDGDTLLKITSMAQRALTDLMITEIATPSNEASSILPIKPSIQRYATSG